MSDITTVRKRAAYLDASPRFIPFTRVTIHISDDSYVTAGDDTGRTMEIDNPWGTQQMAADILAKLRGYQYQPYEAEGALLDPSAEIGDGVNVGSVYGGIYSRDTTFGRKMAANIAAPKDAEIDHEFKYESRADRQYSRDIGDMQATLRLQSDQIEAKVSQENNNQSFGWKLLSDRWTVSANGHDVFTVDNNGGTFAGQVVAEKGKIGGFTISASAIYNNISQFGGSQSSGVYIGTNGIQLGQNFKVDPSGNVNATNMTLSGTLRIGGNLITAAQLQSGAMSAYNNGSYWSGGSGYGYSYHNATQQGTGSYPTYFTCGRINIAYGQMSLGGYDVGTASLSYKDGNGVTRTRRFLVAQ